MRLPCGAQSLLNRTGHELAWSVQLECMQHGNRHQDIWRVRSSTPNGEDLGLSEPGGAVADVLNGKFDADGALPCQTDGGLKCFGHPVGASGLRMVFEHYVQMMGRAGGRQIKAPRLGLSHNLGGVPYNGVAAISIVGIL